MAEAAEGVPFYFLPTRLDLIGEHETLIADIAAQLGSTRPALVVIDTLNRSLRGSESSDQDMGDYVKAADAIREAFGCAVVVVHHCGVDGNRPRGHTSLSGAVDAQIAVKRESNGSGAVIATVEFMKDGLECAVVRSRLDPVEVGRDVDGDPIMSCVIVPADDEAPRKAGARVTGQAGKALDLLRKAIDECGEPAPAGNHIPQGRTTTRTSVWRDYCDLGGLSMGDQDAKQKAFVRAAEKLTQLQVIGIWEEFVWLVD
jgi:hypothetical protein